MRPLKHKKQESITDAELASYAASAARKEQEERKRQEKIENERRNHVVPFTVFSPGIFSRLPNNNLIPISELKSVPDRNTITLTDQRKALFAKRVNGQYCLQIWNANGSECLIYPTEGKLDKFLPRLLPNNRIAVCSGGEVHIWDVSNKVRHEITIKTAATVITAIDIRNNYLYLRVQGIGPATWQKIAISFDELLMQKNIKASMQNMLNPLVDLIMEYEGTPREITLEDSGNRETRNCF